MITGTDLLQISSFDFTCRVRSTQRFPASSQPFQCLLEVLRTFVVPMPGPFSRSSSKMTSLPLPRRFISTHCGCVESCLTRRRRPPTHHGEFAPVEPAGCARC